MQFLAGGVDGPRSVTLRRLSDVAADPALASFPSPNGRERHPSLQKHPPQSRSGASCREGRRLGCTDCLAAAAGAGGGLHNALSLPLSFGARRAWDIAIRRWQQELAPCGCADADAPAGGRCQDCSSRSRPPRVRSVLPDPRWRGTSRVRVAVVRSSWPDGVAAGAGAILPDALRESLL